MSWIITTKASYIFCIILIINAEICARTAEDKTNVKIGPEDDLETSASNYYYPGPYYYGRYYPYTRVYSYGYPGYYGGYGYGYGGFYPYSYGSYGFF